MVPKVVAKGAAQCLVETFSARYGIKDWNSLFYIVHPGGPGVLNNPSVFFVLDEMRRRSAKEGKATTGEGLDPGVLFGFGPGVTIETIVLRSFATD
ncbi:hypothetical protein NC653_000441 [Populus alba x Populus x berolinensis]|uniref:Chalcone/stilbene synthase C-terminal domain-containing protein n=1 Tax=Populus alba x Populus x berolinensis TaxID=444605 RepID=A0AAD6RIL7_9ROSI|nr:hypothetical protein NC653_000441 [Populus alba x Populus x berolinensis]